MIVKMSRYDFVLFAAQSDDFIARLRELGLVDITTTGWEPAEQDRQLLTDIDHYRKAVDYLRSFAESESMDASAKPYASGEEAYEAYAEAQQRRAWLSGEAARLEKLSASFWPTPIRRWRAEALCCVTSWRRPPRSKPRRASGASDTPSRRSPARRRRYTSWSSPRPTRM